MISTKKKSGNEKYSRKTRKMKKMRKLSRKTRKMRGGANTNTNTIAVPVNTVVPGNDGTALPGNNTVVTSPDPANFIIDTINKPNLPTITSVNTNLQDKQNKIYSWAQTKLDKIPEAWQEFKEFMKLVKNFSKFKLIIAMLRKLGSLYVAYYGTLIVEIPKELIGELKKSDPKYLDTMLDTIEKSYKSKFTYFTRMHPFQDLTLTNNNKTQIKTVRNILNSTPKEIYLQQSDKTNDDLKNLYDSIGENIIDNMVEIIKNVYNTLPEDEKNIKIGRLQYLLVNPKLPKEKRMNITELSEDNELTPKKISVLLEKTKKSLTREGKIELINKRAYQGLKDRESLTQEMQRSKYKKEGLDMFKPFFQTIIDIVRYKKGDIPEIINSIDSIERGIVPKPLNIPQTSQNSTVPPTNTGVTYSLASPGNPANQANQVSESHYAVLPFSTGQNSEIQNLVI